MILALKDGIHNEVLVGLLNTPEYSSIPPNSWLLTWRGSTMQVSSKVSKQLFFPLSNPRRKKTSQGQVVCILLNQTHPQSNILIANAYPPRSPHPSHTWYISAPPILDNPLHMKSPPPPRAPPQHFVFIASLDFAYLAPSPAPQGRSSLL